MKNLALFGCVDSEKYEVSTVDTLLGGDGSSDFTDCLKPELASQSQPEQSYMFAENTINISQFDPCNAAKEQNEMPRIFSLNFANAIEGSIDGDPIRILIDTGASISLISKQLYDASERLQRHGIDRSHAKSARSASGSDIGLLGTVNLARNLLDHNRIEHDVYVAEPLATNCILGMDCLQMTKATLDFKTNTLSIPGFASIPLVGRFSLNGDIKLVAECSVNLPPLAQTIIYATSPALEYAEGYEGLIEASQWSCGRYGIVGGRVMAKIKGGYQWYYSTLIFTQ
jgi:predicted aspartyl protease